MIPYADASFSVVLSITGRMNASEFRRVLKDQGLLLVAVPAADDLIELRGTERDRVPRTVAEFAGEFQLSEQTRITASADLDAASVSDVLHSIYRPRRPEPPGAMRVSFSLEVLVFSAVASRR
jgi:hypothetical protein